MTTATATQTKGAATREATQPQAMAVEAKITSGLFRDKMVDLMLAPDGSIVAMSDPQITPEEREAWDELMRVSQCAENSALQLQQSVNQLNATLERVEAFLAEDEK